MSIFNFDTTPEISAHMRMIRKTDTKPELVVRKLAHAMGYRYRLHRRDLPGTPDIVFPSRRKVIFVHGCFWHRHDCALGRKHPAANPDYWTPKLARNAARDIEGQQRLTQLGWQFLIIWECEVGDAAALAARIRAFLGPSPARRGACRAAAEQHGRS